VARFIFTSESVSEGHPDKVCDYISDSILDAYLAQDPRARVACETLCKSGVVVIAGEITAREGVRVDHEAVARQAIREVGYTDAAEDFHADGVRVYQFLTRQSPNIAQGVDAATNASHDQGAGDQGMMIGYATDETPELMPLPILLAHRLTRGLAEDRRAGRPSWLRPDAKSQVSVAYENGRPVEVTHVLVSTQHAADVDQDTIRDYVRGDLVPRVLGEWYRPGLRIDVNPTGSFAIGGPTADAGLTGRKIIVDTYGGMARHGGGAFSGKDPSKVDRSGAYFCRYVARQLVKAGLARRAEVNVAYAIGLAQPTAVKVETFGTGDDERAAAFVRRFDFRPAAIIEQLDLLRPIYRRTTNYGHFGKPDLPWEA
jgi:S-adenosylmethionine synthetase